MSSLQQLRLSLSRLGITGTIRLLAEKRAKKRRLARLLRQDSGRVTLVNAQNISGIEVSEEDRITIIERADEMLRDDNYVFTFLHPLKNIPNVWNYDHLEKKYWPKKRYEETRVHSAETPSDVKIVWEINRFKYLPLLAQAAYLSKEKKYVDEIEWRLLSWLEDNPFAGSINWSSPLEIAIRGISWSVTLRILSLAGFDISGNEKISTSLWQHAAYLNAELSVDKIVRSNHLIGETAGLYIISGFFDFPEAEFYRLRAKRVLSDSVLKQTYEDGGSCESSGWYHTFVTDFTDLALRTSQAIGDPFDASLNDRFKAMTIYRNSIMLPDGDPVRFGDCDFGKAINLPGKWKDSIFGLNTLGSAERKDYFQKTGHITARLEKHYLFMRAGDFGWGGDGFSSHAHDDFLAPIVALGGANILVDPGTFAYNGAPQERDTERRAEMHNGIILGVRPILKPSFGWIKTRPAAFINSCDVSENKITVTANYGEAIAEHDRQCILKPEEFILEDRLHFYSGKSLEWNFHFHPRWRLVREGPRTFALHDFRDNHYRFELSGTEEELEVLPYEFAPAYRQKSKAWKVRLRSSTADQEKRTVRFTLKRIEQAIAQSSAND
ncbi:MAG: heparinase II/III family protein [Bacteroidota bacterium]|nr:heparinase II/III family protein [Bacteroidota bacterium]